MKPNAIITNCSKSSHYVMQTKKYIVRKGEFFKSLVLDKSAY